MRSIFVPTLRCDTLSHSVPSYETHWCGVGPAARFKIRLSMSKRVISTALVGTVAVVLAGCSGGSGHPPPTVRAYIHRRYLATRPTQLAEMYPALTVSRPSGIAVVSLAQARSVVATRAHPVWVAIKPRYPDAALPAIRSAREVRHEGPQRVWLSKSSRGGLCLLDFDPQLSPHPATDHTVTATCGGLYELAKGLALTQRVGPGRYSDAWSIVGVVPSGVRDVSIKLGDGSVHDARVVDNSYSTVADRRIIEVSFVRHGVRQHIDI